MHRIGVPGEFAAEPARRRLPQPHHLVGAARRDRRSVRTERHRVHITGVARKIVNKLPVSRIPQPHLVVIASLPDEFDKTGGAGQLCSDPIRREPTVGETCLGETASVYTSCSQLRPTGMPWTGSKSKADLCSPLPSAAGRLPARWRGHDCCG